MSALGMEVVLTATDKGLKAQLKDAQGNIVDLAETLKRNLPKAANEAQTGIGGLMGKFREFRSEQVQQGRQARFLAGEIMSVIPAGEGAKGALEGVAGVLIEGAAGGLSFGLALEAVKLVVATVSEEWKRSEERLNAIRSAQIAVTAVSTAGWDQIRQMTERVTEAQRAYLASVEKTVPKFQQIGEEYAKLSEAGPGFMAYFKAVFGDSSGFDAHARGLTRIVEASEKAAKGLRVAADMAAALRQEQQKAEQGSLANKSIVAVNEAIAESINRARSSMAALVLSQAESGRLGTVAVILAKEKVDLLALELQLKKAITEEERNAILAKMAAVKQKARDDVDRAGVGRFFTADETADSYAKAEIDMAGTADQHLAASVAQQEADADFKKSMEERKRLIADMVNESMRVGDAIGSIFARMAQGSLSVAAAVGAMAKSVLSSMIDMVKKMVMADAVAAAAEAARGTAGTPVIGPILAASAMVAMLSMVQGLLGSMPSAATGWDRIPYDMPVMVHQGERITTKYDTDRMDRFLEGGGGGTTIINLSFLDTHQADAWIDRRQGAIIRTLAKAKRNGRG